MLLGKPLSSSKVVPGACFILREPERRLLSQLINQPTNYHMLQMSANARNQAFKPSYFSNDDGTDSQGQGGLIRAVFIDGPLLLPRSSPQSRVIQAALRESLSSSSARKLLESDVASEDRTATRIGLWLYNGSNPSSSPSTSSVDRVLVVCSGHVPPRCEEV